MALHLFDECLGVQHEDAAVPVVLAAFEVGLGDGLLRLFEEGVDMVRSAAETLQGLSLAYITISGMRFARADAEQHQPSGRRDQSGALDSRKKLGRIGNDVIGRHDSENGSSGDSSRALSAATAIGGSRVVRAIGFENDSFSLDAAALEILLDEKAVVVVAQQNGRLEAGIARQAGQGRAEKAVIPLAKELYELFGVERARQRP